MKLYWRYKKDGKWTWKSATVRDTPAGLIVYNQPEEEK
jgi:hypothetical protein